MSRAFNAVMRVISSLIGVLMVLMGGIWILQGLNLAWGSLSRSFMQGDQHWVFYGAIMLIVGVCQVVWSNTRQRAMRSVDHAGDRTEDSSGLSGSSETTYFRVGDHPLGTRKTVTLRRWERASAC